MKFTKIRSTEKGGVELAWTEKDADGGTKSVEYNCPQKPLADLTDALKAFGPYVVVLIGAPDWLGGLKVNGISLNEEKGNRRGLVVSAILPIERASNRPLVLNTPQMKERGEGQSEDSTGIFEDSILGLIAATEKAATAYFKGEREQFDAFHPTEKKVPDGTNATPEEEAEEVSRGKKKRRPRSGKDFIPGTGDVVNPDSTVPPADAALRSLLLSAGRDVPADALARWTSTERDAAQRWAEATTGITRLGMSKDVPEEPEVLKREATPSLLDDFARVGEYVANGGPLPTETLEAWDVGAPPKIDDVGAEQVKTAATGHVPDAE